MIGLFAGIYLVQLAVDFYGIFNFLSTIIGYVISADRY